MPYAWSDGGNLLDDGVNTYTYDHANRLTMVYEGDNENTYTFAYNGLGDRLDQALEGQWTTHYSLDLAAGLTQVLSDGHNAYLYGVGRIAEEQPEGSSSLRSECCASSTTSGMPSGACGS